MRMTTSPAAALPSRPRYYRAHLARVLVVGADERPRVLDLDTGAESLLPDHVEPNTFFVLGWAAAASKGGYKVLNITLDRGRHVQVCKVLTLVVGGVWRKAPNTPVDVKREPWWAAVANHGVVYIVACGCRKRADWIAAFDLRTERWRRRRRRGLIQRPAEQLAVQPDDGEDGRPPRRGLRLLRLRRAPVASRGWWRRRRPRGRRRLAQDVHAAHVADPARRRRPP